MEQNNLSTEELGRLEETLSQVKGQLAALRGALTRQEADLTQIQDDFEEERELLFQNLWAADDFENLTLLSQQMQQLTLQEQSRDDSLRRIFALERMADSPYFARVDLAFEGETEAEKVYIGRATLWDEKKSDILVHDWRSPMAGVFYRFAPGNAYYEAPAGRVDCAMRLKRQYEIRRGQMLYCFDTDSAIRDGVLKKMLGQNASSQMRSIVETIQRDQDQAIRDESHELLMIQGAAGSGKSAVALHRAAYLMYEGLKNRLTEQNILILSPNTLFEKYIAGVLPELGERSVATSTLEQLLEALLHTPVQSRAQRLDALCAAAPEAGERMRREIALKSSPAFIRLLDRYLEELPRRLLPYRELAYGGLTLETAGEIKNAVTHRDGLFPLGVWLERWERTIWERVHALRPQRMKKLEARAAAAGREDAQARAYARAYAIRETGALAGAVRAVSRLDCRALYRSLVSDAALLRRLAKGLGLPEHWEECLTAESAEGDEAPLSLADGAAVAYLRLKLYGTPMNREIRQLIVDEAQDYGRLDYAVLNLLFPHARFTVLGDIHQALEAPADKNLYTGVREALGRPGAMLLEMNKSFRCTREIFEFSRSFLNDAAIESFHRSGEAPRILPAGLISREISRCLEKGYQSVALIAKTVGEAAAWRDRLATAARPVGLMGKDARSGAVFVIPLALAKGLEFDAVLILDCDAAHYGQSADAALLYVACTRALHTLTLFYDGTPSPLLRGKEIAYDATDA